jgi:hypothetical protein
MLTTWLISGIKALTGITIIISGWLLVQAAWRKSFPGTPADEDVLAGRLSCHGCTCETPCQWANHKTDQREG